MLKFSKKNFSIKNKELEKAKKKNLIEKTKYLIF